MRTRIESHGNIDSLPEFCSPADLSLVLPVSRATLYRLAEQKRIPSIRLGRRIIIPREPLKEWIKQEIGMCANTSV